MDVAVDAPGCQDLAFRGNGFGAGANDNVHTRLHIGIAGLADRGDAAVEETNVGLVDAGVVDDEGIGDDGIDGTLGAAQLALPHAVADHLAAAELHLLAIAGEVLFHLDNKSGVGKAHAVARGRTEHVRIGRARKLHRHQSSSPITAA